jgi:hypothetical protein
MHKSLEKWRQDAGNQINKTIHRNPVEKLLLLQFNMQLKKVWPCH